MSTDFIYPYFFPKTVKCQALCIKGIITDKINFLLLESLTYGEREEEYQNNVKISKVGKYKERTAKREMAGEGERVRYNADLRMSGVLKDKISSTIITY